TSIGSVVCRGHAANVWNRPRNCKMFVEECNEGSKQLCRLGQPEVVGKSVSDALPDVQLRGYAMVCQPRMGVHDRTQRKVAAPGDKQGRGERLEGFLGTERKDRGILAVGPDE